MPVRENTTLFLPPSQSALTHSIASDKTEVNMTWTAPANGTGQLNFL